MFPLPIFQHTHPNSHLVFFCKLSFLSDLCKFLFGSRSPVACPTAYLRLFLFRRNHILVSPCNPPCSLRLRRYNQKLSMCQKGYLQPPCLRLATAWLPMALSSTCNHLCRSIFDLLNKHTHMLRHYSWFATLWCNICLHQATKAVFRN